MLRKVFSCPVDENRRGDYVRCRHRGFRLTVLRQAFSEDFLEICCRESTKRKIPFTVIPSSRYALVYHFEYGGRGYFHKSFLHRNRLEPIKGFFRGTRAERAFKGHQLLRKNGLGAPQVVVVGKKGRQSFLVSEAVWTGSGLGRYFRETYVPPLSKEAIENKRRAVQTLGHKVGRLHALGIFHGDLRWGNIMVKASTPMGVDFLFLDNERTVQYKRLPYLKRLKNLVQLNMDSSPVVTGTDRLRFFLVYLSENPELDQEKKLLMRRIFEKTAARLARKPLQAAAPP